LAAPSSIPAIDGKSLTGLFFESIGRELSSNPSCMFLDLLMRIFVTDENMRFTDENI
jgi:hypothetical protein